MIHAAQTSSQTEHFHNSSAVSLTEVLSREQLPQPVAAAVNSGNSDLVHTILIHGNK